MRLALFFTKGGSLNVWDKFGMISREIKPYNELSKYFEEIFFVTYGDNQEFEYQNLLNKNITILPNKLKLPSSMYSLLAPIIHRKELKKADVFKTNQVLGGWTAVIAKILFRKKLIVRQGRQWSMSARKQGIKKWKMSIIYFLEKLAYKKAEVIIVASNANKKFIQEKYNISSNKITFVPNYIDTNLFKPLNTAKENRICIVAKLEKQKNLENLIEAVRGLDIKLVIFGTGSLKNKLTDLASLGNVEFKGNIDNEDLPREINKSKLFILPSFYEGCPKVLLEAMACGVPIIGANVYGIDEIIEHKENGYLCDTSTESIKNAITDVLSNGDLQRKISLNARKTILEKFSLEKILKKEIEIYDKILAS